MTKTTLENLVTEAVSLDREIREQQARLKQLKGDLIGEACRQRLENLTPTDGDGWSWTCEGRDGCIARVTMPGRALKAAIDPATKAGEKLLARFGDAVKKLFTKHVVYKPVSEFRALVEQDWPPAQATKLIEACESERPPAVSFETTDRTATV
jgi:hypothetical protein